MPELPEEEQVPEIKVDQNPEVHFREILHECEKNRKRVAQLNLWGQRQKWSENLTKPSVSEKDDHPTIASVIRRAQMARQTQELLDANQKLIDDAEKIIDHSERLSLIQRGMDHASKLSLILDRHMAAIERLLAECQRSDIKRVEVVNKTMLALRQIDANDRRMDKVMDQKERFHTATVRSKIDLTKIPLKVVHNE